jgi:hypothetical protein
MHELKSIFIILKKIKARMKILFEYRENNVKNKTIPNYPLRITLFYGINAEKGRRRS